MNLFGRDLQGFAKAMVVLVAIFLVAAGICGLQIVLAHGSHGGMGGDSFMSLGVFELIAMLLSAAGIVLVMIAWVITAIFKSLSSAPKGGAQKLLVTNDEPTRHEEERIEGNESGGKT